MLRLLVQWNSQRSMSPVCPSSQQGWHRGAASSKASAVLADERATV